MKDNKSRAKIREYEPKQPNVQMRKLKLLIDVLASSPKGQTPDDLLQHLLESGVNCSKRMLGRDLEALQAVGWPIKEDQSSEIWRFESERATGYAFPITPKALAGLYALRKLAGPLTDHPFSQDLHEFFDAIEQKVGETGHEYLHELTQQVKHHADENDWNNGATNDMLRLIRSACTERQVLEVDYESVCNGLRRRRIGPQNIYFAQGTYHLIAEDLELKKTKTFALPRFRAVKVLDEMYEGITTVPDEMLSSNFAVFTGSDAEKIDLLFNKNLAPYVRRSRWHSSQTLTSEVDGRIRLKVDLAVTPEFIAWVMSFGDKVEIISPLSLSQEIERQVFNMAERFHLKQVS